MESSRRRTLSARAAVALLACWAAPLGARQQPDADAALARDPDRGLEPALRARLALVDPLRDASGVEQRAALIAARLRVVAELWSTRAPDELAAALAAEAWIGPELAVAPLSAEPAPAVARGEWSLVRAGAPRAEEKAAHAQGLAPALAAWRALFPREARLDVQVRTVSGEGERFEAAVRVRASGAREEVRLQHDATWITTWRAGAAGVELVGLRATEFASAALAHHPAGLFADVTESLVGAALFRAEVAPGLDEWRRTLPAPLEPGSLGHQGLALGDADGDGLEDVYWCRPGGLPNKLFLHASDDSVRDASAAAGVDLLDYSSSALFLDLDGEGGLDLVVSTGSGLVFFANDAHARFERALYLPRSLATSLAAADYDLDGDLDLYACSYVSPYERDGLPLPYHQAENGDVDALLRNDGSWTFADATAAAGMDVNNHRFTLAASWEDYDQDGDPDLYVANDFGANNLYRNDGGHFVDAAAELGALDIAAGMGVTWGDADEDGWTDLYVTNMDSAAGSRLTAEPGFRAGSDARVMQAYRHHALGNTLLLNLKGAGFRDVSETSGARLGGWGWGSIFLDFDDDGTLDLFAPNGFVTGARDDDLDSFFWRQVVLQSPDAAGQPDESYRLGWHAAKRLVRQGWSWNGHERNAAFLGLGQARFADVSSVAGLDALADARAAARVDWDGDGDEDLVVTDRTAPMLRVLANQQRSGNRWIAFALEGQGRTAVGARVELATKGGRHLVRSLRCGEGYLAQSSARVHFGLGADEVERVTVRWPGGASEDFGSPASGAAYALARGTGTARALAARTETSKLVASHPAAPAPCEAARTPLPTPLPLPRLALETADGVETSLLGITMQGPRGTGRPLLLVPWSSAEESGRRELARLVAAGDALRAAGVQVLALDVERGTRERSRAVLAELAWPFASAFASADALLVLEQVQGALHDDEHALLLPTAFLVDPGGRLEATYAGRLDPDAICRDLALFALSPEERRDACVPFPGRWIAPPPDPFDAAVAERLDAHGLARAAGEYRLAHVEVRDPASASALYEQGAASHRAGRLAEASVLYRKTLERDPGHVRAAQNLAVVLHKLGQFPDALAAYERALQLDPGSAPTRCNLGYLYLALRDFEGAKRQLEALRNLKSELAATLEARIRELEKP